MLGLQFLFSVAGAIEFKKVVGRGGIARMLATSSGGISKCCLWIIPCDVSVSRVWALRHDMLSISVVGENGSIFALNIGLTAILSVSR